MLQWYQLDLQGTLVHHWLSDFASPACLDGAAVACWSMQQQPHCQHILHARSAADFYVSHPPGLGLTGRPPEGFDRDTSGRVRGAWPPASSHVCEIVLACLASARGLVGRGQHWRSSSRLLLTQIV